MYFQHSSPSDSFKIAGGSCHSFVQNTLVIPIPLSKSQSPCNDGKLCMICTLPSMAVCLISSPTVSSLFLLQPRWSPCWFSNVVKSPLPQDFACVVPLPIIVLFREPHDMQSHVCMSYFCSNILLAAPSCLIIFYKMANPIAPCFNIDYHYLKYYLLHWLLFVFPK